MALRKGGLINGEINTAAFLVHQAQNVFGKYVTEAS